MSHDGWVGTNDFGVVGVGSLTYRATNGIVGGQYCYYRYYATNEYGESWSDVNVFMPGKPVIYTLPPSQLMGTTAYLVGNLVSGVTATVSVYWGTADLGPTQSGWDGTYSFGNVSQGTRSLYRTGLTPDQTYCYRYYATNSFGESWGDAVTFVPPDLSWAPHPRIPAVEYTSPGTYSYKVPAGVTRVLAVAIGGGGAGGGTYGTTVYGNGGGGGGLRYSTNIVVKPKSVLTIFVGSGGVGSDYSGSAGGDSFIQCDGVDLLRAGGGGGGKWNETYGGGAGGGGTTLGGSVGGGNGGGGGSVYSYPGGGGGYYSGCGGGVDIFGEGFSGMGGSGSNPGTGGSGGLSGGSAGGAYGGGGGGSPTQYSGKGKAGAAGAVRILGWWSNDPATIEIR